MVRVFLSLNMTQFSFTLEALHTSFSNLSTSPVCEVYRICINMHLLLEINEINKCTHNVNDLLQDEAKANVERVRLHDDRSLEFIVAAVVEQELQQSTLSRPLLRF